MLPAMSRISEVGRFRLLDPPIQRAIELASPEERRTIAVAVATAALDAQPERPPALDRALVAMRSGGVDSDMRTQILQVADALDGRYLDLFDDEQPGGRSDGWETAFRLARAAAAVCYAIDEDPTIAAIEASYEARHALDDGFDLARIVQGVA